MSIRPRPAAPAVSLEELGALLGISSSTVQRLAKRGIIVKSGRGSYDRDASVRGYVQSLEAAAKTRDEQFDLKRERARLAKEQADSQALKNAASRAELLDAAAVEREWADVLRLVRSGLLAVPSRVHQRLAHLTVGDVATIDREIRDVLAEIGNDNPK